MRQRQELLNELFRWVLSPGTNFTHRLFDLIAKADLSNRCALRKGFPLEVELWEEWYEGSGEWEIFVRHITSLHDGYKEELGRILAARNLTRAYKSISLEGE